MFFTFKWVISFRKWNLVVLFGSKERLFILRSIFLMCCILYNISCGNFFILFFVMIMLFKLDLEFWDWRRIFGIVVKWLKVRIRILSEFILFIFVGSEFRWLLWMCNICRLKIKNNIRLYIRWICEIRRLISIYRF